ncbi:MAG: hypothetical protein QGH37_26885 [Candidatus Poribacteria bacterium]|nr:hypothetical protein [Candidatus Poribacteria bacterium]MDP6996210.1 hypothetical protein [Candidatus Poribacteria bacterium]
MKNYGVAPVWALVGRRLVEDTTVMKRDLPLSTGAGNIERCRVASVN